MKSLSFFPESLQRLSLPQGRVSLQRPLKRGNRNQRLCEKGPPETPPSSALPSRGGKNPLGRSEPSPSLGEGREGISFLFLLRMSILSMLAVNLYSLLQISKGEFVLHAAVVENYSVSALSFCLIKSVVYCCDNIFFIFYGADRKR